MKVRVAMRLPSWLMCDCRKTERSEQSIRPVQIQMGMSLNRPESRKTPMEMERFEEMADAVVAKIDDFMEVYYWS